MIYISSFKDSMLQENDSFLQSQSVESPPGEEETLNLSSSSSSSSNQSKRTIPTSKDDTPLTVEEEEELSVTQTFNSTPLLVLTGDDLEALGARSTQ